MVLLGALVFTVLLSSCSAVRIPKCCPLNQQLAFDFHTCITYNGTSSGEEDTSWWLSPEILAASSQLTTGWLADQGQRQFCSAAASTLLLQNGGQVTIAADGLLVVDLDTENAKEELVYLDAQSYCFDRAEISGGRTVVLVCLCGVLQCWTSCCPSGSRLFLTDDTAARCIPDSTGERVPPPEISLLKTGQTRWWQVISFPKCSNDEHVVLLPSGQHYQLLANGSAMLERGEPLGLLSADRYCVGDNRFLYCKGEIGHNGGDRVRRIVYVCLLTVGAVFLLATITVYACLPGLLTGLLSRALIAHCCSLLAAYMMAAVLHTVSDIPQPFCTVTAFVMQFSYLAAFFWLNVMCIDISLAVSGYSRPNDFGPCTEHRKFPLYSAYAWGITLTICIITAVIDLSPAVPVTSTFKPNIGHATCWFKGETAMLVYFYGPVSCVMVINLLLSIFIFACITFRKSTTRCRSPIDTNNYNSQSESNNSEKKKQWER